MASTSSKVYILKSYLNSKQLQNELKILRREDAFPERFAGDGWGHQVTFVTLQLGIGSKQDSSSLNSWAWHRAADHPQALKGQKGAKAFFTGSVNDHSLYALFAVLISFIFTSGIV